MKLKLTAGGIIVLLAVFFAFHRPTRLATSQSEVATTAPSISTDRRLTQSSQETNPTGSDAIHRWSKETQAKLDLLQSILDSKNDNDPRLDSDFRNLSPEAKDALQNTYRQLKAEDRNGKGTIVFLLGREMTTPQDCEFMKSVLNEKPCLSLNDCTKDPGPTSGESEHLEAGVNVTLAYPELVALQSAERVLKSSHHPLSECAKDLLKMGAQSEIPSVSKSSFQILSRLPNRQRSN